jgi:hypothetical protein
VTSFDLARQVEIFGKLTGLPTGGAGTEFRSLATDFRFDQGQIFTDNLRLEMDQMIATGRGVLRLGEPVMCDYDLLAELGAGLTQKVIPAGGALGVAGNIFMNQNMLGVPLKMSGPVTQPSFSLNPAGMGKRATERMVAQPEDTVKGILNLFKGGDKATPGVKKK